MIDYQRLYIAERNRAEELEEELRQYREGKHAEQPRMFERLPVHLRPRERIFLDTFLTLPPDTIVTNEKLENALLSSDRAYVNEYGNGRDVVKVVACTLRRRVEPLGVKIRTVWGQGYAMPRESHEAWKKALAA